MCLLHSQHDCGLANCCLPCMRQGGCSVQNLCLWTLLVASHSHRRSLVWLHPRHVVSSRDCNIQLLGENDVLPTARPMGESAMVLRRVISSKTTGQYRILSKFKGTWFPIGACNVSAFRDSVQGSQSWIVLELYQNCCSHLLK